MALISTVVALIVLTILYRRMIKREIPAPISRAQAIVPVILGVVSTPLSFVLFLGLATLLTNMGYSAANLPRAVRSVLSAFLGAGLPEEIAKLLMILLTLAIFRKNIRNVYEVVLVGAAVGFGFTLFEEFLYGSGNAVLSIGRLLTVAAHMLFGMIMGKHLGFAKHHQKTGKGSVSREMARAILIPMAIHTAYDACTANNALMNSENDVVLIIGLALALASIIALFILQFKVLGAFKKNAETYCGMAV